MPDQAHSESLQAAASEPEELRLRRAARDDPGAQLFDQVRRVDLARGLRARDEDAQRPIGEGIERTEESGPSHPMATPEEAEAVIAALPRPERVRIPDLSRSCSQKGDRKVGILSRSGTSLCRGMGRSCSTRRGGAESSPRRSGEWSCFGFPV